MATQDTFRTSPNISDALVSDQLETNFVAWTQYALLGAGGFFNVERPQSGAYGGDQSELRKVVDPNYNNGQVWEGFRKDWVWETGVAVSNPPIRVSGVYYDSRFVPVGTGLSIDYPNGRAVFAEAISPTGTVSCSYSYRLYQIYPSDSDWFQRLQTNSFRVDDSQFLQSGSGAWDVLAQNRVQLPAIIYEAIPNGKRKGLQLGGGDTLMQDVVCHIIAEDKWHMLWMHDTMVAQFQKRLDAFDKNKILTSGAFPLDDTGFPLSSGNMYPDLRENYYWNQIRIEQTRGQNYQKVGSLSCCDVRLSVEIDLPS
jgi:hypothetical protein